MSRLTIPLPSRPTNKRTRSVFDLLQHVPCPFCGERIGAKLRCVHVVDFVTPAENGGQYAVIVEPPEEPRV